ncbi:MAG TPA: hypothetical protein VH044_13765 [Polyangiaceae bacterium]|nr:hypothetical protein [Polyangiaceae bacterium]
MTVLLVLLGTATAGAWQEVHQTGADVVIEVGPDGVATVHDALRWHVVRGPLHYIDLEGVDRSTLLDPTVAVTAEDGRPLTARIDPRDEHSMRVTVDDPKAFLRGNFVFDVRWRVDWVKAHAIARDGAAWRLSWSSPLASEGLDLVRTTFVLPPSRQAPAAIFPDTGAVDDTALATFRRDPERDVLQLVRPHVGRGEAVAWTVRIDPGALPAVADPRLRPPLPVVAAPEPDRLGVVGAALALGALALGFALLVSRKARASLSACASRGARPRALVPLPEGLRPAMAGLLLAAGVAMQAADALTAGAALVAMAALVAAWRPPSARLPVRGPGRWLILRPDEAFAAAGDPAREVDGPGDLHGRLPGPVIATLGAAAFVAVLIVVARRFGALVPWLVALDSAVLAPLLMTGGARGLPPGGPEASAPWLAPVFERLRAVASLRVAPWGRVAGAGVAGGRVAGGRVAGGGLAGGAMVDELRLLVLPRASIPGLVGVEVGQAWSTTPAGWAASPEVLVRVLEGSSAAARLAQVLPRARALPGRRPDERVIRLRPRAGTRASTVALTRGLADSLTDRRLVPRAGAAGPPGVPAPMAEPKAC